MRADFKPFRDPLDIVDRHIALAAFDATKIGSIHFDLESKILLTHTFGQTTTTDVRRQDISKRARMRPFHAT